MVRFGNHGQVLMPDGLVHLVAVLNERGHWKMGCEMTGGYRSMHMPSTDKGPTCLICARLSMEWAIDEGI